jgi:predicted Zn-dependent peptidase
MTVRRSQLPNGIRIVTEQMHGVPSVTVGIWVENGSRFETRAQGGLSHFLEHMFFKGTPTRTAAAIAEEIDAVGGVLNAFTGKEYTCYYARVLGEHVPIATSLLSDIFLHSSFDQEEIDRERSVVLQEISQVEDTPDDYVHDLFSLRYWPGHPLSFPVCGTAETVGGFQRRDFVDLVAGRYTPNRIIMTAAGDIGHDAVREWVERDFSALEGAASLSNDEVSTVQAGVFVEEKPLEQVHLAFGTHGISQVSQRRYVAYVLNTALGGGMSSRLFQEIREKRGRAYAVHSYLSAFRDAGYLGIYVGTSAEWVQEVCDVIAAQLRAIARDGLGAAELERAKNQLKGGMLLGLETSDARMSRIAKNEIYFGHDITISEVAAAIDAVTNDEIRSLAAPMSEGRSVGMALLGDFKGADVGASLLGGFQ